MFGKKWIGNLSFSSNISDIDVKSEVPSTLYSNPVVDVKEPLRMQVQPSSVHVLRPLNLGGNNPLTI